MCAKCLGGGVGRTSAGADGYWVGLSNATFRAESTSGRWCVPVPAVMTGFDLKPGPALPDAHHVLAGLRYHCDSPAGFHLRWSGPTNQAYAVEWAEGFGATTWRTLTVVAPAADGSCSFTDPDAGCGAGCSRRFYLILPLDP